jgi:hypothetical protein
MTMTTTTERVPEASVESSASAVEWGAIAGGALAAVAISIVLISLGSGLGLSTVSPWSFDVPPPTKFAIGAGIWLIVTQWLASAWGGYLSGRLRKNGSAFALMKSFFEILRMASSRGRWPR